MRYLDWKIKNLISVILFDIFSVYINNYLVINRTDEFDYSRWGVVLMCFAFIATILYIVDVFILKQIDIVEELKKDGKAIAIVIAGIFITAGLILSNN